MPRGPAKRHCVQWAAGPSRARKYASKEEAKEAFLKQNAQVNKLIKHRRAVGSKLKRKDAWDIILGKKPAPWPKKQQFLGEGPNGEDLIIDNEKMTVHKAKNKPLVKEDYREGEIRMVPIRNKGKEKV